MPKKIAQLWGSAFEKKTRSRVIDFTAGRDVFGVPPADVVLLPYDVWVNLTHCVMLYRRKIIEARDAQAILTGLSEIEALVKRGKFPIDPQQEDVHTAIESCLVAKYGIDKAGKLHTGRSRNDQSTTDVRMYLRDKAVAFAEEGLAFVASLIKLTKKYESYAMPGFTHHQHAMVTTFGHVLLGWALMVVRDVQRFTHWRALHNRCPLGGGASYGTSIPIDRELTATLLGFDGPELSSFDGLTNRWEAEADLAFAISALMNHLSQIAQTLMVFSTPEFGMVKLSDEYSTGSSMMPQKKNPDPLEVIKAKASIAAGSLQSLLGIGKANFIGYNRDSQLGKFVLMELIEETLPSVSILKGTLTTLTVNRERMKEWCSKGFIGATSLVEQLVARFHLPFRLGKIVVEKAVRYSKDQGVVTFPSLQRALKEEKMSVQISEAQVRAWQTPEVILHATSSFGGPGKKSLQESARILTQELVRLKGWVKEKTNQRKQARATLANEIKKVIN